MKQCPFGIIMQVCCTRKRFSYKTIIKATMEKMGKKCVFDKGEVGYVEISESTANTAHITQEVGGGLTKS